MGTVRYLVLLEEVDEHVDVAVRDAIDDLAVVLHQFHHHLRRVQPDLALPTITAPSHVVCTSQGLCIARGD